MDNQRHPGGEPLSVLAEAMEFSLPGVSLPAPTLTVQQSGNFSVQWSSVSAATSASVVIDGRVDCTGYHMINVTVTARKPIRNAESLLRMLTHPSNTVMAMGLGKKGGLVSEWVEEGESKGAAWLTFDFGKEVVLDGFKLYSHGDGVHDVTKHYLQVGGWGGGGSGDGDLFVDGGGGGATNTYPMQPLGDCPRTHIHA